VVVDVETGTVDEHSPNMELSMVAAPRLRPSFLLASRAMIARRSHLGSGLYGITDAARIVGASPQKVRRWLDPTTGIVRRSFDPSESAVCFLELMEMLFINMFRNEGVTLQTIRKATDAASATFDTKYPFAVKRFDTDGRTIFATLLRESDEEEFVEDLRRGQYVFKQIIGPFFRKLEYGDQEALRYWPLLKNGRVVLDPNRKMGQPIDSETGVPTRALYDAVLAGGGQDSAAVAKWFDVPQRAVDQAVLFEKSIA